MWIKCENGLPYGKQAADVLLHSTHSTVCDDVSTMQ